MNDVMQQVQAMDTTAKVARVRSARGKVLVEIRDYQASVDGVTGAWVTLYEGTSGPRAGDLALAAHAEGRRVRVTDIDTGWSTELERGGT